MVQKLFWIAVAGAIGTLARYGLSGLVQRSFNGSFPWGTLAVNVVGSFLFGFVWAFAERRLAISSEARIIALTGFMGAFTTFSTFVFETSNLMRGAQWMLAAGNIFVHITLGLLFLFLGLALGNIL